VAVPPRPPAPSDPAAAPAGSGPPSPAGKAAAAAVLALSRAARSFVLYDSGNTVIRQLIEGYRDRTREALERFGELPLEVGPFQIAARGEVVYQDPDREKSLSFRLYRDGVRRLTLLPDATWDELRHLLQILALRYAAVRQQEEDAVTLLRKAEFRGIRLVAVEGFAPSEERPEPELEAQAWKARGGRRPETWDVPLPRLPAPRPIAWQAVPPEALAALQAQEPEDAVARTALGLAADLLSEASRRGWAAEDRDLVQFFVELRDVLLADGRLGPLRELVDLIGAAGSSRAREQLLDGLGDPRALDLVLEAIPEGATDLPADLRALLPLLGLGAALDRLAAEPAGPRRALLVKIVLERLPHQAEAVLDRLPQLEPGLARTLVAGLLARAPDRAREVARRLLGQEDEGLRLEGLAALERAAGEIPLAAVAALLADRSGAIRLRAAEVLGRRGDESAVEPVLRALEAQAERSPPELEALGRALAELAPIPASRHFAAWLQPTARFLRGLSPQQRRLQWAAVAGLAVIPWEEAERKLQALAEDSKDELRRHCLAALAQRRRAPARG
jgi:uncharacterized protein YjeT (DUF2065 family)